MALSASPALGATENNLLTAQAQSLSQADVCKLLSQTGLRHIGIIMDGNRRWAKQRGLPTASGHQQGVVALKKLVQYASAVGLEALTVYAFSTENWQRTEQEVRFLMGLFGRVLQNELDELHQTGIKVTFLGNLTLLPDGLKQIFQQAEEKTQANQRLTLCLAINYGGQEEIVQAAQAVLASQAPLNLQTLSNTLKNQGPKLPPLDYILRPGGEMRLSNFLLWQSAYAELWFSETLWPDFSPTHWVEALQAYGFRQRRFGQ